MLTYNVFPNLYDLNVTVKIMEGIAQEPAAWRNYFNISTEHSLTIKTENISGFGKVPEWKDGTDLPIDEPLKIGDMTLTTAFYGGGFVISRKMGPPPEGYGDMRKIDKLANSLVRSVGQTYGVVHVAVLDAAFTTSLTALGSVALCSASHKTSGVSTRSNLLAAAALTPANLRALELKAKQWVNYRGLNDPIDLVGAKFVYGPTLAPTAEKLIGSINEPFTTDNDVNLHRGKYQLTEEVRLSSTTAYFLICRNNGLISNHALLPTPISYYQNNGSLVKGIQFDFCVGVEQADGIFGCAGA